MSHFSTVRTELRDRESLLAALRDLGLDPREGQTPVRGYRGQQVSADVVCLEPQGCDIGFRWNDQAGHYDLVTDLDLWNRAVPLERFLSQLHQRYALQAILAGSASEGFSVTEQRTSQDGSIELVVTRWHD